MARHPPLLVGIEALIERLPRVSELFQVSRSLSQSISASMHEVDRITVA
jgi:hypothetical protein